MKNLAKLFPVLLAAALLTAILLTGCGESVKIPGIRFYKPSNLGGFDFLESVGDVYICDIGDVQAAEVEVPAKYKGKPVVAVIGMTPNSNKTLTTLKIPEGVQYLQNIGRLNALQTLELPASVTSLTSAFSDSSALTELTLKGDVTKINGYSFMDCKALKSVTFQGDVGTIGDQAFTRCTSLESVTFQGNVGTITDYAFSECKSLRELNFKGSLEALEDSAFRDCPKLTEIPLPAGAAVGDGVFSSSGTETEDGTRFLQPENLSGYDFMSYVGYGDFYICDIGGVTVSELEVPVTYGNKPVTAVISTSSEPNDTLTSLKVPEGVQSMVRIDSFTALRTLELPASVKTLNNAFSNSPALEEITLPCDGVTINGKSFCDCTALKSVTLTGKVKYLEGSAFSGCTALENVTFRGDVSTIRSDAFSGCPALREVVFEGTLGSLRDYVFKDCPALTSIDLPADAIVGETVFERSEYDPSYSSEEVLAYSDFCNAESLKDRAGEILGQSLDPDKERTVEELAELADRFNGPILATTICPDCEHDDYSTGKVPAGQTLEVIDAGRIEYNYSGTVYTPDKAEQVMAGKTPLVWCLVEYIGYGIGPDYTGGKPADYLWTRVSLWEADSGNLLAWNAHSNGYAPPSYYAGNTISFMLPTGDGHDHHFFLEKDGREPTPLFIVIEDIYGVTSRTKRIEINQ